MGNVEEIVKDIKSLKIQGATNVAKAGLRAYLLRPTESVKRKVCAARPTEPLLYNALEHVTSIGPREVRAHLSRAQTSIALYAQDILKKTCVVYTHCHSSTVIKAIILAHTTKKRISVVNTETRPFFQGRKTARELAKAGIAVTSFVDSAMEQALNQADYVLLGADAILKDGVINKVGSYAIAELAFHHKKPVYILADSWKFFNKEVPIEERDFHEVWGAVPQGVKVRNPAFEKIPKKYISKIITEEGILDYKQFMRKFSP